MSSDLEKENSPSQMVSQEQTENLEEIEQGSKEDEEDCGFHSKGK